MKPKYDKEKDYCSVAPDNLFGVTFNYACYLHDLQYGDCVNNRKTRLQADIDFREHIIKIFKNAKKPLRGIVIAWIYFIAVRSFGWTGWINNRKI